MSIEAPETHVVTTWKVACDGGEGALWVLLKAGD